MSRISKVVLLAMFVTAIGVAFQTANADHWRQYRGHGHYVPGPARHQSYYHDWRSDRPLYRYYDRTPSYYRGDYARPYWGGYYHEHYGHKHYGVHTPWGSFHFDDDD